MENGESKTQTESEYEKMATPWLDEIVNFFGAMYKLEDMRIKTIATMIQKLNEIAAYSQAFCDGVDANSVNVAAMYNLLCEWLGRKNNLADVYMYNAEPKNETPL